MVHIVVILGLVIFLAIVIPLIPSLVLDMMGQILVARPDDVDGWVYYGSLLEWRRYDEAAAAAYRAAINLMPNHREAWRKLGNVLTKLGDFPGADEAFRLADY